MQKKHPVIDSNLQNEPVKKRKSIWKKILVIVFIIFLMLGGSVLFLWNYIFSNLQQPIQSEKDLKNIGPAVEVSKTKSDDKSEDKSEDKDKTKDKDKDKTASTDKEKEVEKVPYNEELTHILLIGVDSRDIKNINTNADVLMILTIDQKNKKLKLTSIQRDLLIYVPARANFFKLNSVMFAGPQAMMDVLNANYQLNLSKYAVINLAGAEEIVNILGGLEMDVPNNPRMIEYWNDVIDRTNKDLGKNPSPLILKAGKQLLDGRQAITYARLRKLDTDFQRMARQQEVLTQLFQTLKKSSSLTILNVLNKSFSYVTTNMTSFEIAGIASSVLPNLTNEVERMSIPINGYYKGVMINGVYYTAQKLKEQLPLIREFLNNDSSILPLEVQEYWPTEDTVEQNNSTVNDTSTEEKTSNDVDDASENGNTDSTENNNDNNDFPNYFN